MFSFDEIKNADIEIAEAMQDEMDRQQSHLELIASENIVSKAVMAAMGSHLTNKYAEGYPGKRYYGGCEYVDVVEELARERAKKLFGCTYANVQPHSGAQANLAVFFALVKPGDTVMGMSLDAGGHLTHGSKVNISGTYFNIVSYGVNEDGYIDYDQVLEVAKANKPKLIVAGASAYPRKIDFKNTVLIMTSNAGAENIISPKRLGFASNDDAKERYRFMKERVMEEVKRMFKPEFLNRIDEIIVFHQLSQDHMKEIVDIMLKGICRRTLAQMNLKLTVDDSAKAFLVEKGYDEKYGARPLRRAIQNLLEDGLAEAVLDGKVKAGDEVTVTKGDDGLKFLSAEVIKN